MNSKLRILLADDHAVLRAGLRMLLNAEPDMEVVAEAANAVEAAQQVQETSPNVVLLDISMPGATGLELLKELLQKSPESKFLMLTMFDDEEYIRQALALGASGYVLKQAANTELLSAIRVVGQGGTYLHKEHKSLFFESTAPRQNPPLEKDDSYNRLSEREKEILALIASGYTNRQIAEKLILSEKTIETYKSRLMVKLDLHSRTEIVRYALQRNLIS